MPSIDSLLGRAMPRPAIDTDPDFMPEQSITKRIRHGKDGSTRLTVVVPPWHANKLVHSLSLRRVTKPGRKVLSYALHSDILSSNPELTVRCFDEIAAEIANDVKKAKTGDVEHVRYIGFSLGCAILSRVLGEYKLSGDVSFVAPGGDLAWSLWTGSRTQHLKRSFEIQGYDLPNLQELWQELSPTFQAANNIRGCSVIIYASEADTVIRSDTIPPLVDALQAGGNQVRMNMNRHQGHYGTIVRQALFNPNL
jgi:hypothetical protein